MQHLDVQPLAFRASVERNPTKESRDEQPQKIVPPFTLDSATAKVRAAEDAWNSRNPERVAIAYSENSEWSNSDNFLLGCDAIRTFLANKRQRELDYRLVKSLWAFTDNRIAVRFQNEWRDCDGAWHRSYGNEMWEFDEFGLMRGREASINDLNIREEERKFRWDAPGARPDTHEGIVAVR